MKTLYVHVGHSKTGSSYLQTCLFASQTSLAEKGILYPDPSSRTSGMLANFPQGNGAPLNRHLAKGRTPPDLGADMHCLLSSELLFQTLVEPAHLDGLIGIARSFGYEKIRMLLFIRDPIDDLLSAYSQRVKNGELFLSLSEMAEQFDRPRLVAKLVEAVRPLEEVDLTVKNYSRHKADIVNVLTSWLGIDEAVLTHPPRPIVNRSLSAAEVEAMAILIGHLGQDASEAVGHELCSRLYDLDVGALPVERETVRRLYETNRDAIDFVNATLSDREMYTPMPDLNLFADRIEGNDAITLSKAQFDCIATALGHLLFDREEEGRVLKQEIAELKRQKKVLKSKVARLQEGTERREKAGG